MAPSLYKKQKHNVRKTFFLMAVFSSIVLSIGWLASYYFGSSIILWVLASVVIVINVTSYWKSDKVVIKLTHAKPITRKEYFDFWNAVENICISIGAPMPKLYIIDDRSPNAFATGRNPENSAIVATTGLLSLLDKDELEGVVAHELAHIQNRDTLLMTAIVVLTAVASLIIDLMFHSFLFGGRRDNGFVVIIAIIVVMLLAPFVLTILRLGISRKREFLADATGAIYTRYPDALASALKKISEKGVPMHNASASTAHLFIADPFGNGKGKTKNFFRDLYRTHPKVEDRVKALVG